MTTDEARNLATDKIKDAIRAYSADPECMKPTSGLARDVIFLHAPGLAIYLLDKLVLSIPSSAGETVDLTAEVEKIIHARVEIEDDEVQEKCLYLTNDSVAHAAQQIVALLSRPSAPGVDSERAETRDMIRRDMQPGCLYDQVFAGKAATPVPASVTDVERAKEIESAIDKAKEVLANVVRDKSCKGPIKSHANAALHMLQDARKSLTQAFRDHEAAVVERCAPDAGVMRIVTTIKDRQHAKADGVAPLDGDEAHAHVATLIDLWNRFVCPIPGLDKDSLPIRASSPTVEK